MQPLLFRGPREPESEPHSVKAVPGEVGNTWKMNTDPTPRRIGLAIVLLFLSAGVAALSYAATNVVLRVVLISVFILLLAGGWHLLRPR